MNPAYFVEGHLEQLLIQNICPGQPVRRIGCNGDQVSMAQIAKRVGTLGRLIQAKCNAIIVVFDRERRAQSVAVLEKELRQHLAGEDLNVPVAIGIADRHIENWILADFPSFVELTGASPEKKLNFEGLTGKSALKKLLPKSRKYVETIDGVNLLKSSRPSEMRENSQSFALFFEQISKFDCWWLKR